jgi:hypothetical protein
MIWVLSLELLSEGVWRGLADSAEPAREDCNVTADPGRVDRRPLVRDGEQHSAGEVIWEVSLWCDQGGRLGGEPLTRAIKCSAQPAPKRARA